MLEVMLRSGFTVYYRWTALLNRLLPDVEEDGARFRVQPNVYRPLYGEGRAADLCRPGDRVLEIGCGSGVVSLTAARRGCVVTAVDISPAAIENTTFNAERLGVQGIDIRRSDMYEAVDGTFDVILAHPPYIRLAVAGDDRQWATSASYLEALLGGAPAHLAEDGRVGVIYVASQEGALARLAADHGLAVVDRRSLGRAPFGRRLARLLYANVGFAVHLYTLERVIAAVEVARDQPVPAVPREEGR